MTDWIDVVIEFKPLTISLFLVSSIVTLVNSSIFVATVSTTAVMNDESVKSTDGLLSIKEYNEIRINSIFSASVIPEVCILKAIVDTIESIYVVAEVKLTKSLSLVDAS